MVDLRQVGLTRQMLSKFISEPQTIKAFENLSLNSDDLASVIAELQNAAVLVLSLTDVFTNERVVTSDGEVQITDGGPGGNLTFGLSDTGVTEDTYGDASHLVQIAVDVKGRISLASQVALNSDNVTEGTNNLFFTNARSRSALSGGAGINYNSGTGAIALSANGVGDGQLRQSAAFSVIGRSSNTTGDVADITAASDGQVLRRAGSVLAFGAVDLSSSGGVAGILPRSKGGTGVTTSTGTGANVQATQPQFTNTIGVGTAASASGSGVSFPATQSASTDPNTLDDYEEGAWTPTVTALSGSITSYTATGSYTKIGNVVVATIDVSMTNGGTGAGALIITLPFNPSGTKIYVGAGREAALGGSMLQLFAAGGGSTMTAQTYNGAYPGATGSRVTGTLVYNT